jgi:hypothetical protein
VDSAIVDMCGISEYWTEEAMRGACGCWVSNVKDAGVDGLAASASSV